jgi:hypothetical protein
MLHAYSEFPNRSYSHTRRDVPVGSLSLETIGLLLIKFDPSQCRLRVGCFLGSVGLVLYGSRGPSYYTHK